MDKSGLVSFSAYGVMGIRDYKIDFENDTTIIVGPNGTGKSTFLSLFYLFVTQQWTRLSEYRFDKLELVHNQGTVSLSRETLENFQGAATGSHSARRFYDRLRQEGLAELLKKVTLTKEERSLVSNIVGVPATQASSVLRYIQGELALTIGIQDVEAQLSLLDLGIILYLPTYRRIEKDLHSIFPDIEDRMREKLTKTGATQRQGQNFIEISGFGMSDIRSLIDQAVSEVRDFRRTSLESAYQEYIRDIVRGRIRRYSLTKLRAMREDEFAEFRDRLNADIFTESDQKTLGDKINKLRKRNSGQPSSEDRFLGMFVEQLIEAHTRTKQKEKQLNDFILMITKYLKPSKFAELSDDGFHIRQIDHVGTDRSGSSVGLEQLSSGEKQIVALFAYLLLSKRKKIMVLIDEPELSLSVPWQKSFLPDILDSEACSSIFSVTHSPFVFDNRLRDSVIDVRRLAI